MRGMDRNLLGAIALAAVLCTALPGARAFDEMKYPDWKGQWTRVPSLARVSPNPSFDPDKPDGLAQEAPLTPEYRAILEASLADLAAGGGGDDRNYLCFSNGMPRMMTVYSTMEILIMPETTYMLMGTFRDIRRIFTDGRDWSEPIEPSATGYSIGNWIDDKRDGHYSVLEVETHGFNGPRALDNTGLPLHRDNQTVVKERIFSDKADRNILHDEITLIDHAFTRPWTVTKNYRRSPQSRPVWRADACVEGNQHLRIGKDSYMLSADGHLMPGKKEQAPPDLRYFEKPRR